MNVGCLASGVDYWLEIGINYNFSCLVFWKIYMRKAFLKSRWILKLKQIFDYRGFSYLWEHKILNDRYKKAVTEMRISDIVRQNWNWEMFNNRLYINYRIFNWKFQLENYFCCLDYSVWCYLVRFRCGVSRTSSEISIIVYLNVVVFSCKDKNIHLCILAWAQMTIRWQSCLLLRILLLFCVNLQNLVKKSYLYLDMGDLLMDILFMYFYFLL